jgi:hypothetical protein
MGTFSVNNSTFKIVLELSFGRCLDQYHDPTLERTFLDLLPANPENAQALLLAGVPVVERLIDSSVCRRLPLRDQT